MTVARSLGELRSLHCYTDAQWAEYVGCFNMNADLPEDPASGPLG